MQRIVLGSLAWSDTFPQPIAPKPEEALVSLLLRCDEVNGWASGTTRAHLRKVVHHPVNLPDLIVPSLLQVEALAHWLSVPTGTIAATTYLSELVRFFGTATPKPGDLCSWFVFHLCPACIKEHRVLLRCHFLLGMASCQQHQLSLLSSCTCGAVLQPFGPQTSPFTCSRCGKDWGELPHVPAALEDLEKEQEILACYSWWLSYADQAYLKDILLLLMYQDVVSPYTSRPKRSSRWSLGEPRRTSLLSSSGMGPLSTLVRGLDQRNQSFRFSEKKGEKEGCK